MLNIVGSIYKMVVSDDRSLRTRASEEGNGGSSHPLMSLK